MKESNQCLAEKDELEGQELLKELENLGNPKDFGTNKKVESKFSWNHLDWNNPYRRESKIDLEKEKKHGFRWIETNVLMELIKSKISGTEWSLFMYLIHMTRGYSNRTNGFRNMTRQIPISKVATDTGIPRTSVYRNLDSLNDKKMTYVITDKYGVEKVGVNLRYDTWNVKKYGKKQPCSEMEHNFTEIEKSCSENGETRSKMEQDIYQDWNTI